MSVGNVLISKILVRDDGIAPVPIHQRSVFNLNWSPEAFKEKKIPQSSL